MDGEGRRCDSGFVCSEGACTMSCPAPTIICDEQCVDTDRDINNCGGCTSKGEGKRCDSGFVCNNGVCTLSCPAPTIICDEQCVDINNNAEHCGGCKGEENSKICSEKTDTCSNGECYCGTGPACPPHLQCKGGTCEQVDCLLDSDCEGPSEGVDGFCDSAIDYKCSVRCTDDSECEFPEAEDGEFCRSDGRCVSKVFDSIWLVQPLANTLILPYIGDKCDIRAKIEWGDQTSLTIDESNCATVKLEHQYNVSGVRFHSVKITGKYDRFGNLPVLGKCIVDPTKAQLVAILTFGPVGITDCVFNTKSIAISGLDVPNANLLTSVYGLFANSFFNQSIENWDTRNVTNMSSMFEGNKVYNQPLNRLNTSKVENFSNMFKDCVNFNYPIDNWNTSSATNMTNMFTKAKAFNQDISVWDFSKISANENIKDFLLGATSFTKEYFCKLKANENLASFALGLEDVYTCP